MKVLIEIPKEFEEQFNDDRFKDSFKRVCTDIQYHYNITLSGLYELELMQMLQNAITKAELETGRPKWHKVANGDLPDEKPSFVKRCKAFETCDSRIHKNCKDCNVWNYLYDIKALQKWCKEHGKDFMLFTMEMHRKLKESEKLNSSQQKN